MKMVQIRKIWQYNCYFSLQMDFKAILKKENYK